MPTKNPPAILPIFSCLLAATLWGVLWYPMRLLEQMGIPGLWTTLIIYIAALLPLLPVYRMTRAESRRIPMLLYLIALSSGWANIAFILAVLEGTVVRVLLLFYLSPVWTVLLGWLILRERLTVLAWTSVIMAMGGAMIMLWQKDSGSPWLQSTADLLALSSGFAFAVMNVLIRKTEDIPIIRKMVASCSGVIVLTLIGILLVSPPAPDLSTANMSLAIFVGSVMLITMTYTAQYGVTHLPVHRSAVIFLFEVIAGAVSSAILTDEVISPLEWLGGTLVMTAALLTALDSKNMNATPEYQSNRNIT